MRTGLVWGPCSVQDLERWTSCISSVGLVVERALKAWVRWWALTIDNPATVSSGFASSSVEPFGSINGKTEIASGALVILLRPSVDAGRGRGRQINPSLRSRCSG
jgi:hypothetical protein